VIVVDSVSHTWDDLKESYEKKLKRTRGLEIWDWGKIKPEWRTFTDEFLTTPCHAVVCGRATAIYEQVYNESRGKEESQVVGSKMKTEKETGYEPSLLIEMERVIRRDGGGYDHVAIVMKDRADKMDGQRFSDPTFETFRPHFDFLNIGGEHQPTRIDGDSQALFDTPDSAIRRKYEVEIVLEKIKEAFILADCAGTSKDDKKKVTLVLIEAFGTSSWKAIEGQSLETLQSGLVVVRQELGLDQRPMDEDEIDSLATLMNDAAKAGLIEKDLAGEHLALVLGGEWDRLREIRNDIIEKMQSSVTKAANAEALAAGNGRPDPEPPEPKARGKKQPAGAAS